MNTPNWPELISQLQEKGGMSLQAIAQECGFSSRGALHELKTGNQATCTYERGAALLELHKRVMRRGRAN